MADSGAARKWEKDVRHWLRKRLSNPSIIADPLAVEQEPEERQPRRHSPKSPSTHLFAMCLAAGS